jgi:DNA-binding transcriptional MerR regulator
MADLRRNLENYPWLGRARGLQDKGFNIYEIARTIDVHYSTVQRALIPEERVKHLQRARDYRNRNKAKDAARKKEWERQNPEKRAAHQRKNRLRLDARKEAAETGEDVYDIYVRWGILCLHDVRNDK